MAIKIFVFCLVATTFVSAGMNAPFPVGRTMASQGAIIDTEGACGREPWSSAALYRDTLAWGVAVSAVSYYGVGSAERYAVGGFYMTPPFYFMPPLVIKTSIAQLDIMGVYYEQDVNLSLGAQWRILSFSGDAGLRRVGLYGNSLENHTVTNFGAAMLLRTSRLTADAAVQNISAQSSSVPEGVALPLALTARVSTIRNRYGSQGAAIVVTPSHAEPLRFIVAQEYRIASAFTIGASIASNPTMLGFGIVIGNAQTTGSAAVVNHPYLGWSRGFSADYSK